MTRRLVPLASLIALALAAAPAAQAAPSEPIDFEHNSALDGTPGEIQSGIFAAFTSDPNAQPQQQRIYPGADGDPSAGPDFSGVPTYEIFEFSVAPGEENSSFTVSVAWEHDEIDLDVYVYRKRPNGTYDPTPIAQAASVANPENATFFSPIGSEPIRPGTYAVFVDNWCSEQSDAIPTDASGGVPADNPCAGITGLSNEDDWEGNVRFTPFVPTNKLPRAGITGPESAPVGQPVTFTASGADDDGTIAKYSFDLDGDGRFEIDNARNPEISKTFTTPGAYNVAVRVADNRGSVAFASYLFRATGPPASGALAALRPLAARFGLGAPVFGGRQLKRLVVTYRVTENVSAVVDIFRAGRLVKRTKPVQATAAKTYRALFTARNRRRGTYTVRLTLKAPDGRTQTERLTVRRL